MVFGAYRKDDYADPENFLLQLVLVFERYPDAVIERVTDVRNSDSLQRRCKFPPTIAEAGELLDEEGVRQARARHYHMLPGPERREPRPPIHPANVVVSANHHAYATLRERASAEPDMARIDESGRLWVPMAWIERGTSAFRRFTVKDLEAIYGRHGEPTAPISSDGERD